MVALIVQLVINGNSFLCVNPTAGLINAKESRVLTPRTVYFLIYKLSLFFSYNFIWVMFMEFVLVAYTILLSRLPLFFWLAS